ncbi:hypothetical protein XM25_00675 [Devosia sp. H5989]|nr:hypothetical protein XM25_00675 [Devosia sp. H5989]
MTKAEVAFSKAYAATGHKTFAAMSAGYRMPAQAADQVLARPAVQESIKRQQMARLNNSLLPLALDTIEGILANAKATDSNKLTAAGLVLKYSVGAAGEGGAEKEPHEMTADELQQQIAKLRREAAERAKPVIDGEASSIDEDAPESGVFG